MNDNKLILILIAIIIALVLVVGVVLITNDGNSSKNENMIVNNTTNPSSDEVVEQISTDEQVAQISADEKSATHTIMGEDGYYYTVDDDGNILETLGPSQKYYPNGDPTTGQSSVYYPNAEPAYKYIDKSKWHFNQHLKTLKNQVKI